ncbi:MAG: beta-galactosidase [Candidatus Heimdallarchaeota archaeon]
MYQLTSIEGRFQLNGDEVFLRAGEYHYFRVDPEFWESDLKVLKEEGKLNTISTYVPWIFHELFEGEFDFDGLTHPRRDLRKFLNICRKLDLPVIFRPGPFIYSEYKGFGIPLWIGELYPEVIVKNVDGTLDKDYFYYNVSLNHPKYLELVYNWYAKIAVTPPRDGLNVAKIMIWQSFFEDWVIDYLEAIRDMASELDIPLLFAINEQGYCFNPSNPIKKSAVAEIYGYNITVKTSRTRVINDIPFGNSIVPSIFKGYLQPEYQALFASELGCGWFDPRVKVKNESTVQLMMGSIAHGVKGINMYIVRDGEDIEGGKYHYRSMLSHKSKKLPRFDAVSGIFDLVEKLGDELTKSEEIYDEIAFATYAMNHRIIPGDFDPSGRIIRPIKIINMLAEYGIFGMLLANGYNPKPIALEKVSLKEMKKLKTIFVHNRGAIVKSDYTKLLDYVKVGGHLVTGPNFPVMNEHGFPINTGKLFPAVITKQRIFGRNANLGKLLRALLTFQLQKGILKKYNKYALYHIEKSERQNILRNWRPRGFNAKTRNNKKLHIDYFSREFMWQREDIEPILTLRNKPIGYRSPIDKGTNTVFGTPIGARYVIDAYYKDSKKVKQQNKEFIDDLLARNGVQKTFDVDVEIEIVGRYNKEKKSLLVFLLNRGKKKGGTFKVLIPAKTRLPKNQPLKVEMLYSYAESQIQIEETTLEKLTTEGIPFKIKKDDNIVIRISPQ